MPPDARGTADAIWNSSSQRGIRLDPGMWELLYSAGSRLSIKANGVLPSSVDASSSADCFRATGGSLPLGVRITVLNRGMASWYGKSYSQLACAVAGVRASSGKDSSQSGISRREVGSNSSMQAAPPRLAAMEMTQAME